MSEENNANSSRIQGSTKSNEDFSAISTSEITKINFSETVTIEEIDSSRKEEEISCKEEKQSNLAITPTSNEHVEVTSAAAIDSASKIISTNQTSNEFVEITSAAAIDSALALTPTSKEHAEITSAVEIDSASEIISTNQTSENSKMDSSRDSSMVSTTDDQPETSSESSQTSSCESSGHREIEESILKMIKHIEEEIASEEHVGSIEGNHFQNIELKIKTSRVMVAIEQTIQKLEIAFCLPWIFVENFNEMSEFCGEANMHKLMNEYCKIRDVEDMDICRFQPTVINCINDAFEAGLSRFVDLHRNKLPESETKFLSTMVQFKCMAEWQMGMSAIKAMNKEKTLHKMWTSNEKIKSKIKEMETQSDNYRKKLQEMVDEKNNIIAAHNQTISDLEKRNTDDINAEIFKSNKAMRRVCLTSEEKQKVLAAELQQIKDTYEKLVESNLIVEKTLRDQKSKTRQKLQAVLTKYDTGVGERFAELLRIRDELEDETLLLENKVKEFQLQEIEYNQIMFDKAEVDAQIREEKLLLFMMNRSARIIQRAYKKMLKKRKKGKKGKKGKKAKKPKKSKK